MENKIAKMLIQIFAEEVSETTDNTDEELEEVEEYTDSNETFEDVEEPTPKTFTQEELDSIVENRLKRERKRLDKEYNSKLSKYEELAYLTREGLKAENDEDALEKTRDFYGKQGIKYTPSRSAKEEEILASAEAQDILDNCDSTEDIEKEVKKILSKGIKATDRETLIAQKLTDELTLKARVKELEKLGVKSDVYNSMEFQKFEKQFTKETPIADIYELYRSKTMPKKVIENPGSMRTTAGKEKKKFISEAEYDKMSSKEIEENMDLIRKSMLEW